MPALQRRSIGEECHGNDDEAACGYQENEGPRQIAWPHPHGATDLEVRARPERQASEGEEKQAADQVLGAANTDHGGFRRELSIPRSSGFPLSRIMAHSARTRKLKYACQ